MLKIERFFKANTFLGINGMSERRSSQSWHKANQIWIFAIKSLKTFVFEFYCNWSMCAFSTYYMNREKAGFCDVAEIYVESSSPSPMIYMASGGNKIELTDVEQSLFWRKALSYVKHTKQFIIVHPVEKLVTWFLYLYINTLDQLGTFILFVHTRTLSTVSCVHRVSRNNQYICFQQNQINFN